MAVRIRLQRKGRKKRPFYRVVVADSRAARDGRFIERLGHYNPLTDPAEIVIDEERALNWLSNGAQPSATAKSLLSKVGIMQKFHDQKMGIESSEEAIEAPAAAEAPEVPEAPQPSEPEEDTEPADAGETE